MQIPDAECGSARTDDTTEGSRMTTRRHRRKARTTADYRLQEIAAALGELADAHLELDLAWQGW
jgi:hypothetical protein